MVDGGPGPGDGPGGGPGRASPSGATTVWNRKAQDRGELLSRELAPRVHAARWAARYDGRAGVLNRWVDHVRATTYENVPYADPASGTAGVRVLLLLPEPGRDAEDGSGFVSLHDNHPAATNLYRAAERARLDPAVALLWHVVPWWVGNPARPPRDLLREAGTRAGPYLEDAVDLLDPAPTEVVLLGRPAQRAWDRLIRRHGRPVALREATVQRCPHPGPLTFARVDAATGRAHSDLIVQALRIAGQRARGERPRPPAGGPTGRRRPF